MSPKQPREATNLFAAAGMEEDAPRPLPDRLRLSGTLELAGLDLSISQARVDAIRLGGERWFRGLVGRPAIDTWAAHVCIR